MKQSFSTRCTSMFNLIHVNTKSKFTVQRSIFGKRFSILSLILVATLILNGQSAMGATEATPPCLDANKVLCVFANNTVGIGATASSHRLYVLGQDSLALFESTGTDAYLRLTTKEGFGNRVEIANRPGGILSFYNPAKGDVLNITRAGYVGIGTNTPQYMLDVNGKTQIGTDLYMHGGVGGGDGGRALVHDGVKDALILNYVGDFAGGVRVDSGLSVGGLLDVKRPTQAYVKLDSGDRTGGVLLYQNGQSKAGIGFLSPSNTDVTIATDIPGGKIRFLADSGSVNIGLLDLPGTDRRADLNVNGTTSTRVLQITGGDVAEPFEVAGADTIQPGMVVAIDADHPGQMRLANTAYDRTVAGVISGAGGINAGVLMYKDGATASTHPVALTGRVYVYADAANGAIQPGDLLTTSATPGHAMKVTDHAQAQGAILGKAMSKLDKGTGLVLLLVTLQ